MQIKHLLCGNEAKPVQVWRDSNSKGLTALFDGFVTPVGTISELVADFAQLDALAAATLELVGAVARRRCTKKELQISQYFL